MMCMHKNREIHTFNISVLQLFVESKAMCVLLCDMNVALLPPKCDFTVEFTYISTIFYTEDFCKDILGRLRNIYIWYYTINYTFQDKQIASAGQLHEIPYQNACVVVYKNWASSEVESCSI